MIRTARIPLIVAGLALAAAAVTQSQKNKAPDFKLDGSDGKSHTLASLTKDKPVFLYFINRTCGTNPDAVPFFKKLHEAYGDKLNYYGVINSNQRDFEQWAKMFNTKFPALLDPTRKVIMQDFKFRASPAFVVIDKQGNVLTSQLGYSQKTLTDLNAQLAKLSGKKAVVLDVSKAPKSVTYG